MKGLSPEDFLLNHGEVNICCSHDIKGDCCSDLNHCDGLDEGHCNGHDLIQHKHPCHNGMHHHHDDRMGSIYNKD